MITMLRSWQGPVDVDGKSYDGIKAAISDFKAGKGDIHIKLYPKQQTGLRIDDSAIKTENKVEDIQRAVREIKITVKKYMTEPTEPGSSFDFMAKWNNNVPMPLRTMTGVVDKETRGMVHMKLHGVGEAVVRCMRCGRPLTNPVSRHYGIGPECMSKIGFVGIAIEDVDTIKSRLQELTWEGWIIRSAILEEEEV